MEEVDLLVVGGGINGVGIARDAAGRGLSVMLVEKDDLAAHTSSASSKLVHGGLRYLEHFEIRLVRESLAEREVLLRAAPHIVRPLQFVVPLGPQSRPAWLIRAGLFLYDHLGGRRLLPASRPVTLEREGLADAVATRALSYWDCKVQDSRLVVLNAMDAAKRGAEIATRTELIEAVREDGSWSATIAGATGRRTVRARALVNAAGPWAAELFERIAGVRRRRSLRLVKGSHIVVPRLYAGDHAFLLQNADRRVVFAIPFEKTFTLVGTTDVEWQGPPGQPAIGEEEFEYLAGTIRRYFVRPVTRTDVVWSYSGVRALLDDGASDPSEVTREYSLELDAGGDRAPLLSVFGGKITTYRRLAEQAVDRLGPRLGNRCGRWTEAAMLPGGDVPGGGLDAYAVWLRGRHAAVPPELIGRLARTYGTRAQDILDGVRDVTDLGEHFGAGLHAREVDYLISREWARSAEDVLFRRTKLGLQIDGDAAERLDAYLGAS